MSIHEDSLFKYIEIEEFGFDGNAYNGDVIVKMEDNLIVVFVEGSKYSISVV